MIVPDVNLLIYAIQSDSPRHAPATRWLARALNGDDPVGLPWSVAIAVIRLITNRRVFPEGLSVEDAIATVDGWYARRVVTAIEPGPDHWSILRGLLLDAGTAGNLTSDAHLAALCIERGATLHTADTDFARFPGLRWVNPLAESSTA